MEKEMKIQLTQQKHSNKFWLAWLLLGIVMVMGYAEFVSAEANPCGSTNSFLGTFTQNEQTEIYQFCDDCSYVNFTSIKYPNGTRESFNLATTKSGQNFNYSLTDSSLIGCYSYTVCGDKGGVYTCEMIDLMITENGESFGSTQGLMIIGQLGIVALFLAIGFGFSKEKWKLRTFFFMGSLLMGVVVLNSIRIISGASNSLTSMGNIGLLFGIVILMFMFLYLMIFYLIEVFKYFKNKKTIRWEVGQVS
jgi:hypothetical protein